MLFAIVAYKQTNDKQQTLSYSKHVFIIYYKPFSGGLSRGGKIGIAFAVIGVILAAAIVGIIIFRRQGMQQPFNRLVDNPVYQSSSGGGSSVTIGGSDNKAADTS